jgi:hypothetical protein
VEINAKLKDSVAQSAKRSVSILSESASVLIQRIVAELRLITCQAQLENNAVRGLCAVIGL